MAKTIFQLVAELLSQGATQAQREAALETSQASLATETEQVDSSWIDSGTYDPTSNTMQLDLLGGRSYMYFSVPPSIWEQFKSASSKGQFVNRVIKGGFFPYQEV